MAKDHRDVLAKRSWHRTPEEALAAAVPQQVMHYRFVGEIDLHNLAEFEQTIIDDLSLLDQLREHGSAEIEFCVGPVNWRDT